MSKPGVIRAIFENLWDEGQQAFRRTEVTLNDVTAAIRAYNAAHPDEEPVSDRNPANFFKDFTRRRASANEGWPLEILALGFTGRQLVGGGRCFQFVAIPEGQAEAFPETIPGPTADTPVHLMTSATLPLASRRLGRNDEPWLIQVAVRLRVVETHLSVFSPLAENVLMVDHLQNSVKLRGSEIDAIFLITEAHAGGNREVIATCEVKRQNEDITMDQVLRQPKAVFGSVPQIERVLPLAIRSVARSRLHLIEFAPVTRQEVDEIDELAIVKDVIYELRPAVPGIGR